jgi:hypothetical protein
MEKSTSIPEQHGLQKKICVGIHDSTVIVCFLHFL